HIKSAPYQDGYILKMEITTGTIRVARGYFIILLHEQNQISANVLQVLDSLSAATAVWLSREDAIVNTEIRLRNEFIWGLTRTAQVNLDESIKSRGQLLGYHLDIPYICIV